MRLKLNFFILNILHLIHFTYEEENYLLFPFKKIHINNIIENKTLDISSEIANILIPNNIYLSLKVGSSQKLINSFLTFSQSFLSIGEGNCIPENEDIINLNDSLSYKEISNITEHNIDVRNYAKLLHFTENIIYPNNLQEISMTNFNCFYYISQQITKCSKFGLDINKDKKRQNLFSAILAKNKNIKKSYLSFSFKNISDIFNKNIKNNDNNTKDINNINEGEILLGIPPHEYYKDKFLEKELIEINTESTRELLTWMIRFESVYVEDIHNNSIKYFTFNKVSYYDIDQYFGTFAPEINPIYVPFSIFDYYFSIYFSKYLNKVCFKRGRPLYNKYLTNNDFKKMQIFIYCDKTKIESLSNFYDEFPSLNLKHTFFKQIFVFTGKELFLENNNYLYFILLPEFTKHNKFILGRIFMSKHQFTFNYDTKTIGYYNKNLSIINNDDYYNDDKQSLSDNNNNKNKLTFIIIFILFVSLLLIILGFVIKYIFQKYAFHKIKYEKEALELSYMKKGDEFLKRNYN